MRTIKLVVIGPSGVGKTSIRGKYISGRFSAGYRATIGADFISKTFSHPNEPDQSVTLQIWDTAGQERFASLSTAFFRGADAVLLIFDITNPETMLSLKKWWTDFCGQISLTKEEEDEFPCIMVGNKTDMISPESAFVTESEALVFLDTLVSPTSASPRTPGLVSIMDPQPPACDNIPFPVAIEQPTLPTQRYVPTTSIDILAPNTKSIIQPSCSPKHHLSKSRSRPSSRFYSGTMTSTHTTLTIYHTPSSSLFDVYDSARSSPEPRGSTLSTSPAGPSIPDGGPAPVTSSAGFNSSNPSHSPPAFRTRRLTSLSTGSASSGSGVTITPSLVARERSLAAATENASTLSSANSSPRPTSHSPTPSPYVFTSPLPLPPERGPKLFFTSAKTGQGVDDVFQYVVERVLKKWEYDEAAEARRLHFRDASGQNTARGLVGLGTFGSLGSNGMGKWSRDRGGKQGKCC